MESTQWIVLLDRLYALMDSERVDWIDGWEEGGRAGKLDEWLQVFATFLGVERVQIQQQDESGGRLLLQARPRPGHELSQHQLQLLEQGAAHLTRCMRLQSRLSLLNTMVQAQYAFLNQFPHPLSLFDEQPSRLFANRAAASLQLTSNQRILMDKINQMLFAQYNCSENGHCQKSYSHNNYHQNNYFQHNSALYHATLDYLKGTLLVLNPSKDESVAMPGLPRYAVILESMIADGWNRDWLQHRMQQEQAWLRQLQTRYELSPREAQLAFSIYSGLSLSDYAITVNRSVQTVRTQLKAVFRKLKVGDQGRLVSTLWHNRLMNGLGYAQQ